MKRINKVLAMLLSVGILFTGCGGNSNESKVTSVEYTDWVKTGDIASILPVPSSNKVRNQNEDEDGLSVDIGGMSKKDFKSYTKEMKKLGWDKDISDLDDMYTVDYSDKYHALLTYNEDKQEISVFIDNYASIQKEKDTNKKKKLKWESNYNIIQLLPTPKTKHGDIYIDDKTQFNVNLYQVTLKDFKKYVKECKAMGWEVEDATDSTFKAKNEYECKLNIMFLEEDYNDIDRIDIELDTSSATKETKDILKKIGNAVTSAKDKLTDAAVDPKFKKAMDQYEKFFDEYIRFMKKYQKSDDPLSMMDDYSKYLSEYTKMMDKMNAIDEDKLSTADQLYYVEVTTRINKKLLKIAS